MNQNPPEEIVVEKGKYKLIKFEVTNYGRFFVYFPAQPVYIYHSLPDVQNVIDSYWFVKNNVSVK